ncbi:hypothetical protein AYJ54_00780 [Bradyrhizobium centrolobii]|uniref:Methyltransferase domain-containing protein n=1 Tax=Bradyrhizobium centrolobii TaxID=1505087 RepID=A0A176YFQ9_9BRAD|nr:class I SAM-dependent methyltransferase [Bradyrhizobium centrolobii]OAF05473.1 hypothetical protein AYJ54_00780 [Bradyrhizobium centrolobii]
MRTAVEFDQFYAKPDPWKLSHASFRDRVFRRLLRETVRGRYILELGCGEGHLTAAVFGDAKSVTAVDISSVAIDRAKARGLPNATFKISDFLETSFKGFDVIAALECIYYLSPEEQDAFFAKIAREHAGKVFVMSAPIIGENKFRRYFTHSELMAVFSRHGMTVERFHNLNVSRTGFPTTAATAAARIAPIVLDWLPEATIYQRLYKVLTR